MVTSPAVGFGDVWLVLGSGLLGKSGGVCGRVGDPSLIPAGVLTDVWFEGHGPPSFGLLGFVPSGCDCPPLFCLADGRFAFG